MISLMTWKNNLILFYCLYSRIRCEKYKNFQCFVIARTEYGIVFVLSCRCFIDGENSTLMGLHSPRLAKIKFVGSTPLARGEIPLTHFMA